MLTSHILHDQMDRTVSIFFKGRTVSIQYGNFDEKNKHNLVIFLDIFADFHFHYSHVPYMYLSCTLWCLPPSSWLEHKALPFLELER
jgi:hypothetical protein